LNGETSHQVIDYLLGILCRMSDQMGIFDGGQDAPVAKDLLETSLYCPLHGG
jgi:hypothetical protein